MSEYIPLNTLGSSASSSETSLFNQPSTSTGLRHRSGYIAVPIHSSTSSLSSEGSYSKYRPNPGTGLSTAVGVAGANYDPIFQSQLGVAAADPTNPISASINRERDAYYRNVPRELSSQPLQARQGLIKPYNVPWNEDTIKQYHYHWLLSQQTTGEEERSGGIVLPFSNNIGPGNPIGPAKTDADLIAQGHDLHYAEARNNKDISAADREAISQFAFEAAAGSNPVSRGQAAIGLLGLGAKHLVEQSTGRTFYGKSCHDKDR